MPAFNLSLRITHKIAAIGLMGIAGLAAVGGIYVLGNSAQETHRTVAADARAIFDGTNRLFVDLLEARRAEKDFLLRNEEKYAERHATLAKAIASDFDALSRQIRSAGLSDLDARITSVRAGFGGYLKHFTGVIEAKRKLGLDEGSGLEGALRKSVHAIETKLKDFDEPRLAVTMLMMRRHEKDFMLRRDSKYGGDMRKRGAEFAAGLAAATIPAAARDDIARMLEAYQRDFFAWMQGAEILAAEQKATSEAYAKIEPLIETILQSVAQVRIDAEAADTTSRAATTVQMQTAIALVILAVAALAFLIGRAVSRPLTSLARAMRLLADGQFDVALPGLGRRDEIGAIAQAVETFKVKAVEKAQREAQEKESEAQTAAAARRAEMHRLADHFESAVGGIVQSVSSASTQLAAAAGTLTKTAENTQHLSGTVAAASQQASSNVQSVAAAAEQMTGSVGEISRQVMESSKIASAAVRQAERTDARVGDLSLTAGRIGDVVKLITAIAEQTNLLALNATIEAARAGDAGRGFAVVASEVKALAAQTAKATEEIGTQIAAMQAATEESVTAIKEIGATITRISGISTGIAAAVEEQGAATQAITRNARQAAEGTHHVASNIVDVNRGAGDTGTASTQVLASAQALSGESSRLKSEVENFLATVRAA